MPFEPRREVGRQHGQRAARAVDVEPQPFGARRGGQRVEIVDGAGVDGSGGAHHAGTA